MAMPASCAMRLTELFTPDASPESACPRLDITAAVSGATSTANEMPSIVIGPITPNPNGAVFPKPIAIYATAAPDDPAISIVRAPIESAAAPNTLDNRPTPSVNGRNANPASVGD